MRCKICGAELQEGAVFCACCGTRQDPPPASPAPFEAPRFDRAAPPARTEPAPKGAGVALALSIIALCAYSAVWLFSKIRYYYFAYEYWGSERFSDFFKDNLIGLSIDLSYLAAFICLSIAVIIIAGKLRKAER